MKPHPDGPMGRAAAPSPARAYRAGVVGALPFVIAIVPFGMLFGVVATEAGLDIVRTMVMTTFIIAGASQFAVVQLLQEGAPALIALGAALMVNLRMAMYSASLAPHLGKSPLWLRLILGYFVVDQVYGLAIRRYHDHPRMTLPEKVAYFLGVASPVCPLWIAATYLGARMGSGVPEEWAIDFAAPVTFIAIAAPMLRGTPHFAAAFVAIVAALAFAWMPWSLGLLFASALGMLTGAWVEVQAARRAAA